MLDDSAAEADFVAQLLYGPRVAAGKRHAYEARFGDGEREIAQLSQALQILEHDGEILDGARKVDRQLVQQPLCVQRLGRWHGSDGGRELTKGSHGGDGRADVEVDMRARREARAQRGPHLPLSLVLQLRDGLESLLARDVIHAIEAGSLSRQPKGPDGGRDVRHDLGRGSGRVREVPRASNSPCSEAIAARRARDRAAREIGSERGCKGGSREVCSCGCGRGSRKRGTIVSGAGAGGGGEAADGRVYGAAAGSESSPSTAALTEPGCRMNGLTRFISNEDRL